MFDLRPFTRFELSVEQKVALCERLLAHAVADASGGGRSLESSAHEYRHAVVLDYADIKRTLDWIEQRAVTDLRDLLLEVQDALLTTVQRAFDPRRTSQRWVAGLRLRKFGAVRTRLQEVLQEATESGGQAVRREVPRTYASGWDDSAHPRHPKGSPQGGEFAPKGGINPSSPESIAGSLAAAASSTARREKAIAGLMDALQDGVRVKSGKREWTKQTVAGDVFWTDGKKFLSSRQALIEIGTPIAELIGEEAYRKEYASRTTATPKAAIKAMRDKGFWVSGILEGKLTADAQSILVQAIKNGESIAETVRKLQEAWLPYLGDETIIQDEQQLAPYRLETIVRTNTTDAYNTGRLAEMRELGDFVQGARYSAILDERTTELCRGLDGKVFRIDDPDLDRVTPPNHFNCRSILVPVLIDEDVNANDFVTGRDIGTALDRMQPGFGGHAKYECEHAYGNPNHYPAGSPKGGQFAPVSGGSSGALASKELAGMKIDRSKLGAKQAAALDDYMEDGGFREINSGLRKMQPSKWASERIAALDEVFDRHGHTLENDVIVFRGVGKVPFKLEVGTKFYDRAFLSTTTDKDVAVGAVKGATVLRIKVKAGSKVIVPFGDKYAREVILSRGSAFKVTAKNDDGSFDVERLKRG